MAQAYTQCVNPDCRPCILLMIPDGPYCHREIGLVVFLALQPEAGSSAIHKFGLKVSLRVSAFPEQGMIPIQNYRGLKSVRIVWLLPTPSGCPARVVPLLAQGSFWLSVHLMSLS